MSIKGKPYQSPEVEVIDICAESIVCTSAEEVTVSDPWGDNVEYEW